MSDADACMSSTCRKTWRQRNLMTKAVLPSDMFAGLIVSGSDSRRITNWLQFCPFEKSSNSQYFL